VVGQIVLVPEKPARQSTQKSSSLFTFKRKTKGDEKWLGLEQINLSDVAFLAITTEKQEEQVVHKSQLCS
jgi:hypothetical protein